MKSKALSAVLTGLMGVGLLCGFAALPEENSEYTYKQFETYEPVTAVRVMDSAAIVDVRTADTDHITVEYADRDGQPIYDISVQDGCLTVETLDKSMDEIGKQSVSIVRIRGYDISVMEDADHDLVITLPKKQYDQIELMLAFGSLSVDGVEAKELSAFTATGILDAGNLNAGTLELDSAAGSVSLHDSQAQDVVVESAVGLVKVQNLNTGSLSAFSAVGTVSLKQVTAESIETESALGSLSMDQVSADSYDCTTIFGSIEGDLLGDESQYALSKRSLGSLWGLLSASDGDKPADFTALFGLTRVGFAG